MSEFHLTIKTVRGDSTPVTVPSTATVADLKQAVEEATKIPASEQKLIFSGKIISTDGPLTSFGIEDGNSLHLVRSTARAKPVAAKPAAPTQPQQTPVTTPTTPSTTESTQQPPQQQPAPNPFANLFGQMGAMGGFPGMGGMGGMDPSQMFSDPIARNLMESMLQNPEFLRQSIQSNPFLQSLMNSNPQMQASMNMMLNNPELLRASMRMMEAAMRPQQQAGSTGDQTQTSQPNPFGGLDMNQLFAQMGPMMGQFGMPFAQPQTAPQTAPQGTADEDKPTEGTATAGAAPQPTNLFAGLDMNQLFSQLGGMMGQYPGMQFPQQAPQQAPTATPTATAPSTTTTTTTTAPASTSPAAPASTPTAAPSFTGAMTKEQALTKYATQVQELHDMGFFDDDVNAEVLIQSNGSLQIAVQRLMTRFGME